MIIYLVAIVALMYFIMIRPQRKKQKKEEEMRNKVQIGDEILTIGGFYGRVVALKEDSFIIECGPDRAKLRVAKWAMQQNFTAHETEPKEVTKPARVKKEKKEKPEKTKKAEEK